MTQIGIKRHDASFGRGWFLMQLFHANNEASRSGLCCLQAKMTIEVQPCLGLLVPILNPPPTLEGRLRFLMPQNTVEAPELI